MNQHTLLPKKTERLQYFGSVSPIKGEKPVEKEKMKDLQNIRKDYFFDIQHVGVANVSHPVTITSAMMPAEQTTAANFTMTCNLPRNQKGINMSRLTELLQVYHQNGWILSFSSLQQFTKELAENMGQSSASVEVRFPWFFERKSLKLEKAGLMHADIFMSVTYRKDQPFKQRAGISAKVTTLCPCSKEISEYSAHNQRGTVSIWADIHPAASLPSDVKADLLHAAESNASARLHPVLKRPDEKAVTETAYENPRFVEDLVRLIAADLFELEWVSAFEIECRNEESIHLHDAYAKLRFSKQVDRI
ncbi:GTP cyclohydrolase FolE2 [Bacillus subtilis]|uniref:GTP cyclohydrolase FolE2 n=1 Tax=Bacillus subtilis TaxID=1423 RepID=UPI000D024B23|nr:GTP cyclohydrolase FolE2 [Bacillus subtilis]PRS89845.1 GTP cyclohydrolase I FolE2 [Bacillus subtilis subsp. subtilis]PRS91788.1 GTP cyclohydrolase I FolE2 [Bacillus subtilis subsp. subtilis]